jgi:hypothetical protein
VGVGAFFVVLLPAGEGSWTRMLEKRNAENGPVTSLLEVD